MSEQSVSIQPFEAPRPSREPEADGQSGQHDEPVGQQDARRELDPGESCNSIATMSGAPWSPSPAHDDTLPDADHHGAMTHVSSRSFDRVQRPPSSSEGSSDSTASGFG